MTCGSQCTRNLEPPYGVGQLGHTCCDRLRAPLPPASRCRGSMKARVDASSDEGLHTGRLRSVVSRLPGKLTEQTMRSLPVRPPVVQERLLFAGATCGATSRCPLEPQDRAAYEHG